MQEEPDFKDLALGELWRHSSWKARQFGYDRAAADVERGASGLPPMDDLRSAVSDANAIALDSGIKLLIACSRAIPNDDVRTGPALRQAVAKPLAEKGLGASKPAAKQNAAEALLMLVEVADPEGVVEDILPLLSQRAPKLVAAGTAALARVFGDFGSPVADPRPVLAVLPRLFGHSDRSVRSAATELAVSLYRWVGEAAMMQILGQLKPVQLNELKGEFAKVNPGEPVKRLTRKQAAAEAAAEAARAQAQQGGGDMDADMDSAALNGSGEAAGTGLANAGPAEIDPWDLATPEDVVSKISADFWAGLQSSKWKERHEALSSFLQRLEKVPRLDPKSDYTPLVNEMLRIAAQDLNQLCATEALQILTCLANGLRQSFQINASRVLEVAVERFKEKKATSIETVSKCLDAVFLNVLGARLQPVLDPVLRIGLVHKTPSVKLESTKYLAHLMCETPTAPTSQEMAEITPLAVQMMGAGSEPIRAAAATVLAALVKIMGESSMARALDTLDEHKKKRVAEAVSTVTVKARTGVAAAQTRSGPSQQRAARAPVSSRGPPPRGGAAVRQTNAQAHAQGLPPSAAPRTYPQHEAPTHSVRQTQSLQQQKQHQPHPPYQPPPASQQQSLQLQHQSRQPPERTPPSLRAPTTPAPTRGSAMRSQVGAEHDEDVSHMSVSGTSPLRGGNASPGGRPSVSSTPKIVKRSLAATEFTPARGVDPHRRRLHSPAKPAHAMDDSDDAINADLAQVARLKAELDFEQRMRRELEARLATAQVEHEREVRRLSEKIATLKVELHSAREDFAVELQHSRRAAAAADADDVRGRLNTLNLDEQALRAPRAREGARSPAARPHSMFGLPAQRPRLVPIANQDGRTAVRPQAGTNDRDRTGSEAWERAVTMTHDIRERVERLKARRQPPDLK